MKLHQSVQRFVIAAMALLLLPGCGGAGLKWPQMNWPDKQAKTPARPPDPPSPADPSEQGSVRSFGLVEGMRKISVRGFGIVGNLANTGGWDCPDVIRKYLEAEIRRRNSANNLDLDPKMILDSKEFAPVAVIGEIPAVTRRGEHFDLIVEALGNQTVSLEDGFLYFCDLKVYSPTPRGVIDGRTLAEAQGPLYVSPFGHEESAATKIDTRRARVLGGGRAKEDRRFRISLNSPSYTIAAKIRDRLNGRFGATAAVADAVSPATVNLTVPAEFADRPRDFIDLVLHTIVNGDPNELRRRAGVLAEAIVHPDASYEDISLTWEAIGRTVVDVIRRLYDNRLEAAAYYAARAGLRLGDEAALEIIAHHASNPRSAFREAAVAELGRATKLYRSADRLRMLLSDSDNRIRILAYEALRRRNDRSIESVRLWNDLIVIDLVDCDPHAPALIYAQQSEQQRIAVFGRITAIRPPALVADDRNLVTISADLNDREAVVVRRNPLRNVTSDPIRAPLQLARLLPFLADKPVRQNDGSLRGLGLSYTVIVDVLDKLTKNQTIPAAMVLERPRLRDIGRIVKHDRPESEF